MRCSARGPSALQPLRPPTERSHRFLKVKGCAEAQPFVFSESGFDATYFTLTLSTCLPAMT
jgi:hypothetical protein